MLIITDTDRDAIERLLNENALPGATATHKVALLIAHYKATSIRGSLERLETLLAKLTAKGDSNAG